MCRQIAFLDATQNRIQKLSANLFLSLDKLQVLKLSENNLQSLPAEIELAAELRLETEIHNFVSLFIICLKYQFTRNLIVVCDVISFQSHVLLTRFEFLTICFFWLNFISYSGRLM